MAAYRDGEIENVTAFVKANPNSLIYSSLAIKQRFDRAYQISTLLGWYGSVSELVTAYPQHTILASDARSEAFAHIFLRHGQKQWTVKTVGNLMRNPLEYHLLAIALGEPYEYESASRMSRQFPEAELREELVASLLNEDSAEAEAARARVGGAIIRVYKTYVEAKKKQRRYKKHESADNV
jgi:hypothetical protein